MTSTVQLCLEECTIVFDVRGRNGDYVQFDIAFRFHKLQAVLPPVRDCWMSVADIKRLAVYAEQSLAENGEESDGPFAACDAFFSLEFLEGDTVRFLANCGPVHPLSVGVEGTIQTSAVRAFRDGWLREASVTH